MIFVYGDSHAHFNFRNLSIPFVDNHCSSITMHRVGRDNQIIRFNHSHHDNNSILCFCYGEVDCRCHIQRQINMGRNEDDIIHELVEKYFTSISNNVNKYKKVLVFAIVPPVYSPTELLMESESSINENEFPVIGSNEDSSIYRENE